VQQGITAHGGRVSVVNLPGKGCVFSLVLPDAAPLG
jgi:signal transduction histidine kinase